MISPRRHFHLLQHNLCYVVILALNQSLNVFKVRTNRRLVSSSIIRRADDSKLFYYVKSQVQPIAWIC